MNEFDLIVVGAGISGLSFAHYAQSLGLKTLILEKESRIGGLIESPSYEDFWLELGGHTCYNSYSQLLDIIEACDGLKQLLPRQKLNYFLWQNKEIKSISSQIQWLPLLLNIWRLKFMNKEGHSLKSYYSKVMGKNNYENLLHFAFRGVLSQPPDDYPANLLFNKRPQRRKTISRKFTLQQGLQQITNIITDHHDFTLLTHATVNEIQYHDHQYTAYTTKGKFTAKQLALATPVQVTTKLLHPSFPTLATTLTKIKTADIETVGIVYQANKSTIPTVAGLITTEENLYSSVSRDTVPHPKYRGMSFHFNANSLNTAQKETTITKCLNIPTNAIQHRWEKNQSLPSPRLGHQQLIKSITHQLQDTPLYLTGNYFHGISIEDCIVRSHQEFKRLQRYL